MWSARFERILCEHESMVYGIAYQFFRNPAVAEQLTQDVFIELFRSRSHALKGSAVVAWLRRTTANRCIEVSREESLQREVQKEPWPDLESPCTPDDVRVGECVRRLVTLLPEAPRAVIVLRYGQKMTPEEIGHTLDMPVSAVGSHLRHAMALLHEKASSLWVERVVGQAR